MTDGGRQFTVVTWKDRDDDSTMVKWGKRGGREAIAHAQAYLARNPNGKVQIWEGQELLLVAA